MASSASGRSGVVAAWSRYGTPQVYRVVPPGRGRAGQRLVDDGAVAAAALGDLLRPLDDVLRGRQRQVELPEQRPEPVDAGRSHEDDQLVEALDPAVLRLPGGHPGMLVEHRQDLGVERDEDLDLLDLVLLFLGLLDGGPSEDGVGRRGRRRPERPPTPAPSAQVGVGTAGAGRRRHGDAGAGPAAVLAGDVVDGAGDARPQPEEGRAVPRQRRPGDLAVGQHLEPLEVGVGVEVPAAPALAPQRPHPGRRPGARPPRGPARRPPRPRMRRAVAVGLVEQGAQAPERAAAPRSGASRPGATPGPPRGRRAGRPARSGRRRRCGRPRRRGRSGRPTGRRCGPRRPAARTPATGRPG